MEKKEREALKKRLLEMVINEPPYPYPITMAEVMVNDMSKPNLKPLLNFIEKELDKAREEGRKNTLEEIKESMESYLEDDTTTYEMVEMLLTELKTKEDEK